jgi:hypothetical protein
MALFKSKKFWTAVGGVVAVALSQYFGIAEGTTAEIVAIVVALVLGQGLADFGKEAKK